MRPKNKSCQQYVRRKKVVFVKRATVSQSINTDCVSVGKTHCCSAICCSSRQTITTQNSIFNRRRSACPRLQHKTLRVQTPASIQQRRLLAHEDSDRQVLAAAAIRVWIARACLARRLQRKRVQCLKLGWEREIHRIAATRIQSLGRAAAGRRVRKRKVLAAIAAQRVVRGRRGRQVANDMAQKRYKLKTLPRPPPPARTPQLYWTQPQSTRKFFVPASRRCINTLASKLQAVSSWHLNANQHRRKVHGLGASHVPLNMPCIVKAFRCTLVSWHNRAEFVFQLLQ